MEAKYERRKQQLLEECTVAPEVFDRVMPRLEGFMGPFVEYLVRSEQVEHAHTFVQGLLSDLEKRTWSRSPIASARVACPCSGLWASLIGMTSRCETSSLGKSARSWAGTTV